MISANEAKELTNKNEIFYKEKNLNLSAIFNDDLNTVINLISDKINEQIKNLDFEALIDLKKEDELLKKFLYKWAYKDKLMLFKEYFVKLGYKIEIYWSRSLYFTPDLIIISWE
ncbi:hypothetical protein [Fluviispira vulneris]|uniref:hypothetical protein n=1 Tax=Fluviispira vulneris TaxID=2763012 RepID=UPI0016481CD6|nr:hypothetical protein [Fluviispira vulneris]